MAKTKREQKRLALRALMEEHELSRETVAELLHSSVSRVEAWLKPETSSSSNEVPPEMLELLQYKLADKKVKR